MLTITCNALAQVHYFSTSSERLNPNLYDDGKVCLSLLGTWSGPGWVPNQSTILQVLLSIQALILVDAPFFNEPGFEKQAGQSEGLLNSTRYNEKARLLSLRSAVVVARRPPQGFAKHVKAHFNQHGAALVASVEAQCNTELASPASAAEASSSSSSSQPSHSAAAAAAAADTSSAIAGGPAGSAAAEASSREGKDRGGSEAATASLAPSAGFVLALRRMLPTLRAVLAPS